jgi:Bacterial regulatory helix-turn-helix protein, lysR family
MKRGSLDDLSAHIAVGREHSFTKAVAKLGVSQSALSQTIRQVEERLGVRLLTRTTRSVSPDKAFRSPESEPARAACEKSRLSGVIAKAAL